MSKIASVDIDKLDMDIQTKTEAIDLLTYEREVLLGIRKYVLSHLNDSSYKPIKTKPVKAKPVKAGRKKSGKKKRISEFVLELLKKGEMETKSIVQAWADYVGKPYNLVYNSANNALGRQKEGNEITFKTDENGNRTWYKK